MAAVLLMASGAITMIDSFIPDGVRFDARVEFALATTAVAVGTWAWFAPWQRWPEGRTIWLLPVGLGLLGLKSAFGAYDPFTFGAYIVAAFVWVGVTQPRGTTLKFLPLAAAVFVLPTWFRRPDALISAFEIVAMCAMVGETLAWVSKQLRRAEGLETSRMLEMEGLLRAGEMLAREADAVRVTSLVADLAGQLLRADRVLVLMPEDEHTLVVAAAARWPETAGMRVQPGEAPAAFRAITATKPAIVPARDCSIAAAAGVHDGTLLFLPLHGTKGRQGLVVAALARQTLTLERFTEHVAMTFATQAGLTLERLQAAEALLHETLRDELTGVGNRRYANLMLSRIQPGDAVVILDLDHFKEVNDVRGHAAGDDALRFVAAHLTGSLREGDAAARFGGDEFLLVLRGVADRAHGVADRIAERWRATAPSVDFSMGVAVHREDEAPEQTLERADKALYEAKANGRGRTVSVGVLAVTPG